MKGAIMDNWSIRLTSSSKDHFEAAMAMAFSQAPHQRADYYSIIDERALAFLWGKPEGEHGFGWVLREANPCLIRREAEWDRLGIPTEVKEIMGYERDRIVIKAPILKAPYKMDAKGATDFGWNWLRSGAQYPPKEEYDDPRESPGFTVETDYWGHVWGHRYGIIGIRPTWALIGK